jgi:hypothetical protein
MNDNDQGMGLSVAVYALAMAGGLALCVLPVLWASGATVYENPAVKSVRLPGGPSYARRQAEFPLALLKRQPIVDQTALNELNAQPAPKAPPPHRVARAGHRNYAQAAETDEQRPARRGFFSWF